MNSYFESGNGSTSAVQVRAVREANRAWREMFGSKEPRESDTRAEERSVQLLIAGGATVASAHMLGRVF